MRAVLCVCLALLVGCERGPREPVELDLTSIGLALVDGAPRPLAIETAGEHRRIVAPAGTTLEFVVRLPRDARLRFTIDPHTPEHAFAVSVGAGPEDRPARLRRVEGGDWEAALDGEEGALCRVRLANRGSAAIGWWQPRISGTASPRAPILPPEVRPPAGPVNVVFVLVDALRADHLSLFGYRRPTTPELARLAAEHGVVFEQAYATGPSTPNSIPALFVSRQPSVLGINFRTTGGAIDRTLAEAFDLAGFHTAAFVANPLLLEEFGYARGFGAYEILRLDDASEAARGRLPRADVLVDRALEYLSVNREASCFVYVHLMDVHNPYDPPPSHRGRFANDGITSPAMPRRMPEAPLPAVVEPTKRREGPWITPPERDAADLDPTRYDESIAWVDAQLGRLVGGLASLGMAGRTAVVVTADHGEALGNEDDGRRLHGHALFEELAHVPLVLWLPWLDGGRRIGDVVSLIDLAPTLVDLVGATIPASFVGRSFLRAPLPLDPPAAVFERLDAQWTTHELLGPARFGVAEWGIREGPWKLLMERGRVRLFHLPSDPKETTDVLSKNAELGAYLVGRIARSSRGFASGERPPEVNPAGGQLDRPLTEALQALGYIEK